MLGAVLLAGRGWAHGPLDHSTRVLVGEAQIELVVTLGADATHEFLAAAGFPEAEIRRIQSQTSAQSAQLLPADLAAKLFEVLAEGKSLAAQRVWVMGDGMESLFLVDFDRPPEGELEFHARFFDGIANLKQGAFVVFDENQQPLGAALLTRGNNSMQISLPRPPPPEVASAQKSSFEVNTSEMLVGSVIPANDPALVLRPSFFEFLKLGVEHILLGFDHLLFLGALLMGVRKIKPMFWVITCFTLAHSVTLALAALELVTVSSRIVEPLIALSIIVVAVANLVRPDAVADRYWLAGGFGLIHGFGFASVLRETGLAQGGQSIVMPLCAFNLGVELGQLAVAALAVPLIFGLRRWPAFLRYGIPATSVLIITLSGYWFLQRTVLP